MFNKNKEKIKVDIVYEKSFIEEDYNIANDVIKSSDNQNILGSHINPFSYDDHTIFNKLINGYSHKKKKRVDKIYKKAVHNSLSKNIERYLTHIYPFFNSKSFTVLVSFDKTSLFNSKENPYLCEKRISMKLKLYIKNKYMGNLVYIDEKIKNEFYSKNSNSFKTFKYSFSNYHLNGFSEECLNSIDEKNIMLENKETFYTVSNMLIFAVKKSLMSDIKDFFSKKYDLYMSSIEGQFCDKQNIEQYKTNYLIPLIETTKNDKKSIQEFSIYHFIGYEPFWFSCSKILDFLNYNKKTSIANYPKMGFHLIWPVRDMKSSESERRTYEEYNSTGLTKSLFECDILNLQDYDIDVSEINENNFSDIFQLMKLMKY